MVNEKIDLIEKSLTSRNIKEYEIYFKEKRSYESIFLKNQIEIERDVNEFEYFLRILFQKENITGIGIVKGNSLEPKEIERTIDTCILYSKNNLSAKYFFPIKSSIPNLLTADPQVINDPLGVRNDVSEELLAEVQNQKDVFPTFGRFRVNIDNVYLRNSNSINLNSQKTYFFLEFSIKAQENGKLAEYWPVLYIKEKNDLNFAKRVPNWAKLAKASLKAKLPLPEKGSTVIFSPQVLYSALNQVIGAHASGKAFHEKLSLLKIGDKVASENFSLIDDGLLEGGLGSNGWDDEGSPHQRSEIINQGIFQKRLYDQKYALLENKESTGNGIKTDGGAIVNGISNFEILPGDLSLDEIISNIDNGYYIEQFSWLKPNPISGIFGSEIRSGYYIQNGKIAYPIKMGNVSGSIFNMIKNCLFISKERKFFANTLYPYIAFGDLTVSS